MGASLPTRPAFVCLDGPRKGQTIAIVGEVAYLGSDATCQVRVQAEDGTLPAPRHARILAQGDAVDLEALEGADLLINGQPVVARRLLRNDIVQLGKGGPCLRYFPVSGQRITKPIGEIVTDSVRITRSGSSQRGMTRVAEFARHLVRDAIAHSSKQFRIGFLVLLGLVLILGGALTWITRKADLDKQRLREDLAAEGARLHRNESINATLAEELDRERKERRLLQDALETLQTGVRERAREDAAFMETLKGQAERAERGMRDLERDVSGVVKDVALATSIHERFGRGVCLLAIGVTFFHEGRQAYVRFEIDPDTGARKRGSDGFEVTIGGSGEKYIEWCSGSGFLISKDGLLASNRHVIDPWWEDDEFGKGLVQAGFRPVRETFVAFFPGRATGIPLGRVAISETADVALARLLELDPTLPVIDLEPSDRVPRVGQKTVLLGYPLGLEGLLTKLPPSVFKELVASGVSPREPVKAMTEIAKRHGIQPAMTQGVLSNVGADSLVYDAVTISGGSGGPLFSSDGWVIGVNQAITRFQGANLGVPISAIRALIEKAAHTEAPMDALELSSHSAVEVTPPAPPAKVGG